MSSYYKMLFLLALVFDCTTVFSMDEQEDPETFALTIDEQDYFLKGREIPEIRFMDLHLVYAAQDGDLYELQRLLRLIITHIFSLK